MNKSDIIKAAELAQETIGWAIIKATQGDLEPLYELAVQVKWDSTTGKPYFPIAAAELLKQVEVVEAAELPQEGDLCVFKGAITENVFEQWELADKDKRGKAFKSIVYRNGKPVITKDTK